MSTQNATASSIFIHAQPSGPRRRPALVRLYHRFNPSQGWATLALMLGMLLIVGSSVDAADWVASPGLMDVIFLGSLAGLILAKIKIPFFFLHPIGLALGIVVVIWQTTGLTDTDTLASGVLEILDRVDIWYEAARNDGISTDLLPFALGITALGWLMGYVGSWYVFRSSNVWVAIVLGGTALLTNLSFLPDKFGSRFFLFTFFAMLLIVRMSVVQSHILWKRNSTTYSHAGGWLTMHGALWFSVVVLVLAALLPMRVLVSQNLAHIWSVARTPVEGLEDHFARLFSGVPNRKEVHGRFFGKTLPFVGKISFGGEVVFWADTEYPSYWLSQTYSEYTSQGWKAGDTRDIHVGPNIVSPPRSDFLKRVSVDQSLQLSFATRKFLSGGSLDWVSHDGVVESLAPKEFEIDLLDDSDDRLLPEDIQIIGAQIREELRFPPDRFVESFVSRILPEDLVLGKLTASKDRATGDRIYERVTLVRKAPITPEIVSWAFSATLQENEPYTLVSFVSLADDDDLRKAETDYGRFITDHYLQLPSTLPDRVREKALKLIENSDTPLDKALAVQEYLRSDGFTYSHDIDAPPRGVDGVDHFLFETKTGYSDYFASSMTVMLRAVGVPARMAAGYAPGEWDPKEEVRVVRDQDSHGWTQVYFPDYGWIDFEPTPNWPRHERRFIAGPGSGEVPNRLGAGVFVDDESLFQDPPDPDEDARLFGDGFGGGPGVDITGVVVKTGIGMVSAAVLIIVVHLVWNFGLGGTTMTEQLYAKMNRLAVLAGVGRKSNQTPAEFARSVEEAAEEAGPAARRLAWAFSSERYSENGIAGSGQSAEKLMQDWRDVRVGLISKALRRLMPFGGE